MTRRAPAFIAILIAMALSGAADAAQRSRQKQEPPPPPPPQFKVDVPTKTIELARVASNLANGSNIGKFRGGCAILDAMSGAIVLHPEDAFNGIGPGDYMNVFSAEAGAANYAISGAQQGNLFEEKGASRAQLQVGAGVTDLAVTGCFGMVFGFKSAEVEATITVDWQVFDPLEKKLLYRASKVGHAKLTSREYSNTFVVEGTRQAFRDSARAILSDPSFVLAVKDPNGAAPSANSLFPEATASVSTDPTRIIRLALSNKDFATQVDDIKKQVVTVRTPGGSGSAYFISDTLLLTNEHVVNGFKQVNLKFLDGHEIQADVVTADAPRDVALLRTQNAGVIGIPLRLDKPGVSSRVFVIGSPGTAVGNQTLEGTVTSGIVSAFRELEKRGPFIQSDVAVTHGNSGGLMFDDKGNVIGMTDLGLPAVDGQNANLNLFIPIDDALRVLKIDFAPVTTATAPK